MISLLSDESGKFMPIERVADPNATRLSTPALNMAVNDLKTNLSAENIYNERQFKLEVLEWLNNGEAKIFRSPTEGNYIVRLMNVSLTPNDTLGRMLHTFQCTAYEIAEWNFKNLVTANLIELPTNSTSNLKIGQIQPQKMINLFKESKTAFQEKYPMFRIEETYMKTISFGKGAYGVNITEATPGTVIGLIFAQGNIAQPMVQIEIGGTGAYYVQTREYPLTAFQILSGNWDDLKVTFEYYDDTPTDAFSNIANMTMTDEIRRLIGPGYELNIPKKGDYSSTNNIVSDIRREVGSFHYIRVEKRFIQEMWPVEVQGKKMYSRNSVGNDLIHDKDWNPAVIYHNKETDKYYNYDYKAKGLKLLYSRDENGQQSNKPDFRFRLNSPTENVYVDLGGRPVDAQDEVSFGASFGRIDALRNVGPVDILQIGNGVIADVAYRVRTKEYVVESEDAETIAAKKAWMTAQADIEACITKHQSMSAIENAINFAHDKYEEFIQVLKTALKRKGVEV
jgi:hypothetical protein